MDSQALIGYRAFQNAKIRTKDAEPTSPKNSAVPHVLMEIQAAGIGAVQEQIGAIIFDRHNQSHPEKPNK